MSTYPPGGGIENQVWGLSHEMVRRGHQVHILERYNGVRERMVDGIRIHGVKTFLNDPFISFLLFSGFSVSLIKRIRPDVIYLSERFTALFPSLLPFPKLFVTHNRDAFNFYRDYALSTNPLNYLFYPIKRGIELFVMKNSQLVCPITPSLDRILRTEGFKNTLVLPNSIRVSDYHDAGLGDYIFYSGQLRKFKAVDVLIKAFETLPEDCSHYRLIIGGTGPEEGRLRTFASASRKSGKIQFVGWSTRETLVSLYAECTLFVLPSLFETFSIVCLEAMASHKAVLASDIIGPKDIIEDGKTGILFPPGDVDALVKKLAYLLTNPAELMAMGERAHEAATRLDFRATADSFERAILRLTASDKRDRA
jgi:glycosyltransferase involved in cell wall biosynthesis